MNSAARARLAWGLATLVCALHFGRYLAGAGPIVGDARYYTYFAGRVAHGGVPYREFFENKTPLGFLAGAGLDRLGHVAGVEPITSIRLGSETLAAVTALLAFFVARRWGDGDAAGFIGLLVHTAFPLLAYLPSVGVLPKLLMALCASAMGLAVGQGRYALAGAAGALAFWDWQIGGLAALGAFASALVQPGRRLRNASRVVAGGLVASAPLLAWLWWTRALVPGAAMTLGSLFNRSGIWWTSRTPAEKAAHLWEIVRTGCPGHAWLFLAGLAGALVFLLVFRSRRGHPSLPMWTALGVYHLGVVAFSFYDFQAFGDLFILLHSIAFFTGVLVIEAWRRGAGWLHASATRRATGAAALVMLVAIARPFLLRPRLALLPPEVRASATLQDQRELAHDILAASEQPTAVVGPAELLFLEHRTNAIAPVYWNSATYAYYRRSEQDAFLAPLQQILAAGGVRTLVLDGGAPRQAGDRLVVSADGACRVVVRALPAR